MEDPRSLENAGNGETPNPATDGPRFRRFRIDTHPCFLNVVLLETHPDKIVSVGEDTIQRIHRIRETRLGDLEINWDHRVKVPESGPMMPYHYRPRLHVMSGTFDLSAIFLSSSLELSAWMQDGGLMAAGQDINVALLPKAESLPGGDAYDSDFNWDFLNRFSKSFRDIAPPADRRPAFLDPDLSFVSAIKVKLSPLALWPEAQGRAALEEGVVQNVVAAIWGEIEAWRRSTRVTDRKGKKVRPEVALGLSFGWSEVLVVAYSDSPGKLLELSVRLRAQTAEIQSAEHSKPNHCRSHAALTTITTLGHDFELRRQAQAALLEMEEKARKQAPPEGRDGEPDPFPARDIVDIALEIGKDLPESALEAEDGEPEHPFLQVGCHAYPGHEWRLLELLADLEEALKDDTWFLGARGAQEGAPPPLRSMICIDSGKRDVWTPMIRIGRYGLSPRSAAALADLVQIWVRNGGRGPLAREVAGERGPTSRIPDAFDFYTRISCLSEGFLEGYPRATHLEKHITVLPSQILAGKSRLKKKFEELIPDSESPNGPRRVGVPMANEVKEALRVLQLPYSLSEQILHVVNMLLWAHDREIVWDESVELVPPVLALADFLRSRKGWWLGERERLERLKPVLEERFPELWAEERDSVSRQLERSPDEDLIRLNRAFRTYFYNVHFSSYMTGEMPDLNLRYKGSVHQLLRITNLILDALTDVVLGPRACMAIIDDRTSPEVSMPCYVTVVQLNSSSFTIPFMLETLAHEVAHQLLITLNRWVPTESTYAALFGSSGGKVDAKTLACEINPWIQHNPADHCEHLATVAHSFAVIKRELFHERIDETDSDTLLFIESAADFLEMLLLQGGVTDRPRPLLFKEWAQRFLLRASLAATATSIDLDPKSSGEGEGSGIVDTPAANHKQISSVVTRVVVVYLMCELVIFQPASGDGSEPESLLRKDYWDRLLKALPHKLSASDVDRLSDPEATLDLASLLFFLRDQCVTGPDSTLRRGVLASWDSWREWILGDVLHSVVWLRDQRAFDLAIRFFESIVGLAAWIDVEQMGAAGPHPDNTEECIGYQGTGRFWPSIRDAFRELWHDPAGDEGGVLKDSLLPALYVRHWLDARTRDDLRASKPEDPDRADLYGRASPRWRAEVQPLSKVSGLKIKADPETIGAKGAKKETMLSEPGSDPIEAKTLIFQRGGFRPADKQARSTWDAASRRFLARLLWMVPAWHRSILFKIEGVLREEDPADGA